MWDKYNGSASCIVKRNSVTKLKVFFSCFLLVLFFLNIFFCFKHTARKKKKVTTKTYRYAYYALLHCSYTTYIQSILYSTLQGHGSFQQGHFSNSKNCSKARIGQLSLDLNHSSYVAI